MTEYSSAELKARLLELRFRPELFESLAMDVFRWQYTYNETYSQYCKTLGIAPQDVHKFEDIPLLPITAFKYHSIKTGHWQHETIFRSSGTTMLNRSAHYVREFQWYKDIALSIWEDAFGSLRDVVILALLPGYLERGESSLVAMVDYFVSLGDSGYSGFYLYDTDRLMEMLVKCSQEDRKVVLFGVSYALLQFSERYSLDFPELMIIETGGMKGLREDMLKEDLFIELKRGFGTENVFSEYGMTELLSQSYTNGNVAFNMSWPQQMVVRQINDPLSIEKPGKQGLLGVIDLSNADTCSFILTEDTGRLLSLRSFEWMGRLDQAEIRGCNLLIEDLM